MSFNLLLLFLAKKVDYFHQLIFGFGSCLRFFFKRLGVYQIFNLAIVTFFASSIIFTFFVLKVAIPLPQVISGDNPGIYHSLIKLREWFIAFIAGFFALAAGFFAFVARFVALVARLLAFIASIFAHCVLLAIDVVVKNMQHILINNACV